MSSAETARAQALAAERAHPPEPAVRPVPLYAGLATRAVAFAIDAAAINAVALAVGGVFALCTSLLHLSSTVEQIVALAGAGVWLAWAIGWFVVFWSTTGQTPGDRVMRIHVRDARDPTRSIGQPRALLRLIALVLGAIPLFAGYVPMLLNDRRRAFHDLVAHTVVVHDGAEQAQQPPAPFAPPLAPG